MPCGFRLCLDSAGAFLAVSRSRIPCSTASMARPAISLAERRAATGLRRAITSVTCAVRTEVVPVVRTVFADF
jgi:hypothetical protein